MIHGANPGKEHEAIASMLRESLSEYLEIAEVSLNREKAGGGQFGYPCGVLLLMVADAIGSYVVGGGFRNHFAILNHSDYYNLGLSSADIGEIRESLRCRLTHNAAMPFGVGLEIGASGEDVYGASSFGNADYKAIRLIPFLDVTKKALTKFLGPDLEEVVRKSDSYQKFFKP